MTDASTSEFLNPSSPEQERGRQLYEVVAGVLGDAAYADVVAGEPGEVGNDFSLHYLISQDRDPYSGKKIEGQLRIEPITTEQGALSSWFSISPEGHLSNTSYVRVHGGVAVNQTNDVGGYKTEGLLSDLTQGRVIDPNKEVVIDRPSANNVNKGLPIRRVYKRRGLKLAGRKAVDKTLHFLIEN